MGVINLINEDKVYADSWNEELFNILVLIKFRNQYKTNPVYRQFWQQQGVECEEDIKEWTAVPAVPEIYTKEHHVPQNSQTDFPLLFKRAVVGERTGKMLPFGEIGVVVEYDLHDNDRPVAVRTHFVGYETENGIEIVQSSDVPCNSRKLVSKVHGAPCSTVADGMIKAHGAPCSTVVDGMIKTS